MKSIFKYFLVIVSGALLKSCLTYRQPVETKVPINNTTYQVDYLFEHDGCKVYRFLDLGNYVYFTNCAGNVTSISRDSTERRVVNQIKILPE